MQISKRLKIFLLILVVIVAGLFGLSVLHPSPFGVTGAVDAERVYAIAIQKSDISICDQVHLAGLGDISNFELKEVCYESYAKAHPTPNICPGIQDNFRCVNARATTLGDASICLPIQSGGYKALCVSGVAARKHDVNICNILTDSNELLRCKQIFTSNQIGS